MKNIAVIGSGTMGNGIAHVFAQHHFKVCLIDISQEALDKAQADKAEREAMSGDTHNMSADEHAQMSDASSAHGH